MPLLGPSSFGVSLRRVADPLGRSDRPRRGVREILRRSWLAGLPLPRFGVGLTPLETRRDVVLHVAARAEQLGYESFHIAEGRGHDAAVLLTEVAVRNYPDPPRNRRAEHLG